MGNVFEGQHGGHDRTSSSATAGEAPRHARSRTLTTDQSAYFATEGERRHLRMLYEMIYVRRDGEPDRESLQLALNREPCALLVNAFFFWLKSRLIQSYEEFENAIIEVTRFSSQRTVEALYEISQYCRGEDEENDKTRLFLFARCALLLISDRADTTDQCVVDTAAAALENFFISTARRIDPATDLSSASVTDLSSVQKTLIALVNEYTPHVAKALHTYLSVPLLLAAENPSFKPFLWPALSAKSDVCTSPLLLNALALHCEELQSDWQRLYSTTTDGLSFNRISHHVLGYDGPTCMLIKCSKPAGCIFGSLTTERWKEMNKFYGSSRSILFTFSPKFRIFRSKIPGNGAYQWLNQKSFNLPHGLGLGGTVEGFRVFIPDSLENCTARDSCPTYENGKLLAQGEEFEIDTLEIWGCGGHSRVRDALKAQQVSRKTVEEALAKARKVDKAAFFDSSFDREFLLGQTFSHEKEKQDRLEEY